MGTAVTELESKPPRTTKIIVEARSFRNSRHAEFGSQSRTDSHVYSGVDSDEGPLLPQEHELSSLRSPPPGATQLEDVTNFSVRRWGSMLCRDYAVMWTMKQLLIMWIPRFGPFRGDVRGSEGGRRVGAKANPFLAIVVLARPILAQTNVGQSNFNFGQSNFNFGQSISGSGVCHGPKGWGPNREKIGPRTVGAPMGGGPEGWGAQNFALFFFPSPATISFFLCLSGCLLVEFWCFF